MRLRGSERFLSHEGPLRLSHEQGTAHLLHGVSSCKPPSPLCPLQVTQGLSLLQEQSIPPDAWMPLLSPEKKPLTSALPLLASASSAAAALLWWGGFGCFPFTRRPLSSWRASICVVMLRATSISLWSSYSSQTDLLATIPVTWYGAITCSASDFSCTELVLDLRVQGRISQMTQHANKTSFPHANPNVQLFQAQDVRSDHDEVPRVYGACHYTLRWGQHLWLTSTREQEMGRQGCCQAAPVAALSRDFCTLLGVWSKKKMKFMSEQSFEKQAGQGKSRFPF